MCGIVVNSPKRRPGEPWRYDESVFRVFPRHRQDDHYVASEWDLAGPVAEDATVAVTAPPPAPTNGGVAALATVQEEEEPSEIPSLSSPAADTPDQPSSQADVPTSTSSPTASGISTKPKGRRVNKDQKQTATKKEAHRVKYPLAKKVNFDLADSAIRKRVRFAMDLVTRSIDSSTQSSSSSSSLHGSDDSFVDLPLPNVPVATKNNEPRMPKRSTSRLPPNVVAESSSSLRDSASVDLISKVASWTLSPPTPSLTHPTIQRPTQPIRPSTPFSYAPDDEEDLDSELGSSIDHGSAAPSWRERVRKLTTKQNTKWNAGSLNRAPPPTTSNDLDSDLGSNVDASKKWGPRPSWHRPTPPYEPPSVSDDPNEENRFRNVTWRDI